MKKNSVKCELFLLCGVFFQTCSQTFSVCHPNSISSLSSSILGFSGLIFRKRPAYLYIFAEISAKQFLQKNETSAKWLLFLRNWFQRAFGYNSNVVFRRKDSTLCGLSYVLLRNRRKTYTIPFMSLNFSKIQVYVAAFQYTLKDSKSMIHK